MIIRHPTTLALLACALTLGMPGPSRAAFQVGTQGFADLGTPTIDTDSLATATVFHIDAPFTTRAATGDFASVRSSGLELDQAVLDLNDIGSFVLGSEEFGYFRDVTSVVTQSNTASVRSYQLNGVFTPGTRYNSPGSTSATLTISFTQTNGSGMAISNSGTLSVPAFATAPEPASLAMLGLGLGVAGAGVAARRHRA